MPDSDSQDPRGPSSPIDRRLRPELRAFGRSRARLHAAEVMLIVVGVVLIVLALA